MTFVLAPEVTLLDPFLGNIPGTLYITNYKIYFRAIPLEKSDVCVFVLSVLFACDVTHTHICGPLCFVQPLEPNYTLDVPLGTIQRVEKIGRLRSKGENAYGLEICCKVCVCV